MLQNELLVVAGCNAAGKSTFIRTRLNELANVEVVMADVYKGRTKEVFGEAISKRKDIILETTFNDASIKDLINQALIARYNTSMVVLFLDSPQQSKERVAFRTIEERGLVLSGGSVNYTFNESFKNIAESFYYFHNSQFFYTGDGMKNQHIMSFNKSEIVNYQKNDLQYPKIFASYAFGKERLPEEAFNIIQANKSFSSGKEKDIEQNWLSR